MNAFFLSTDLSTIRVQEGLIKILILFHHLFKHFYLGDVQLGVVDTANVRLNLIGKRVQIDETANEHFRREILRKAGVVHMQGYIADESAVPAIDVSATKGTVKLHVRDWFSTLQLDRHLDH